jgi:hypothetical protein
MIIKYLIVCNTDEALVNPVENENFLTATD